MGQPKAVLANILQLRIPSTSVDIFPGQRSRTRADEEAQAQAVPAEEDGGPGKVEQQLQTIEAEGTRLLSQTSLLPDQPRRCPHEGVE